MANRSASILRPRTGAPLREASSSFSDRHGLTLRERDVMLLLAGGVAHVADLAGNLQLRPNTVHNHLKGIFRRTCTRSKSELLAALLMHALERTDLSAQLHRRPQVLLLDGCRGFSGPLAALGMRVQEGCSTQLELGEGARVDVVVATWVDAQHGKALRTCLGARLGAAPRLIFAVPEGLAAEAQAEGYQAVPQDPYRIAFELLVLLCDDPYARSRLLRVDGDFPALVDGRVQASLTNVGFGGAFIALRPDALHDSSPIGIGGVLELALSLPDEQELRTRATVVWTRQSTKVALPTGMGVRFTDLAGEDRTRLEDFIRRKRMGAMMASVARARRRHRDVV